MRTTDDVKPSHLHVKRVKPNVLLSRLSDPHPPPPRSLMQGLDIDSDAFDLSDWDQRLPPPAAAAAVRTLCVVVVSAEQAGEPHSAAAY